MGGELNSYQLAGLIGSSVSKVMLKVSQASSDTNQIINQASTMTTGASLQASEMRTGDVFNQLAREQQQLDLMYQAEALGISKDALDIQGELIRTKNEFSNATLQRELNDLESNLITKQSAQNRISASAEAIVRQATFKVQQGFELNEIESALGSYQIESQKGLAGLKEQQSRLSAKSSKASAQYEKKSTEVQAKYLQKSAQIASDSMKKQARNAFFANSFSAVLGAGLGIMTEMKKPEGKK